MVDVDSLVLMFERIRLMPIRYESSVVDSIRSTLESNGVSFRKEVWLSSNSRVDFLTYDGVAIECKKGKPNSSMVSAQVERYARCEDVKAIILVSERGLISHIDEACGKPVRYVALTKNWGIAI